MRDSANDAFFTAESLENISEALVREGIQNALDAAKKGSGGERDVRVRISFVPSADTDARAYLRALFEPAKQHFEKGISGIQLSESFNGNCGYLVFEDFGTKGLSGDISEWRLDRAEENAFFSFFRAEGRSAKSGENLGRWGIGKQVFPTASRLHAMLGLTVRTDSPTKVLMGSAVVRSHSIDSLDFEPDGWFGCRSTSDDLVMPVEDEDFIHHFCRTFGLKRENSPGLSVVVPVVDDRLSADDLRRGVVRSFFWPILSGELTVEIETPGFTSRIDAETLTSHRTLLDAREAAVVEFAVWASVVKPNEIVTLGDAAAARPDWKSGGDALLPESKLAEIRSRLEAHQRTAVRIPVRVRPKTAERAEKNSYFTVFIESCRDVGHRTIFLRDGIVITDVRCPQMTGNRSLVVVDDAPLAGLLGDSEGVNHTQWQKDSPKFHNRYIYGPDTIKFVSRSVFEILQRLHAAEKKGDPTLLVDLFFLPSDDVPSPSRGSTPPPNVPPNEPPDRPPPPQPKKFDVRRADGGFVIVPGAVALDKFPFRLRVEAGYAVRRGDAISRWAPDDFAFIRAPLRLEPKPSGVQVVREAGNTLEVEIRKPDFLFGVTGFDKRRDLVVRPLEMRSNHEADV